jgi:DNA-binding winged helix-turn-helix (wHTH) protein
MVLQYLAERPGQIVSKHELLSALWQDTTVSEGVLKTYVWEIRRALGDQLHKPRFIETIPRRGYRFIGPVQSPESKGQSLKSGRQHFQSAIRLPPPSGGNLQLLWLVEIPNSHNCTIG